MRTNQEYKNAALDRLRGNWKPAVLATLIYVFVALIIIGAFEFPSITLDVEQNLGLFCGLAG